MQESPIGICLWKGAQASSKVKIEPGEEAEEAQTTVFQLSADKQKHNAVAYRMSKAAPAVKRRYESLKKSGAAEQMQEFIDIVMSHKAGKLPEDFVDSCTMMADETETGEEGCWESWAKSK